MSETWYRYEYYGNGEEWSLLNENSLYLRKFNVIRTTAKGVWLTEGYGSPRFVLCDARKRFACPTEADALTSFIARKNRHVSILHAQLRRAEAALRAGQRIAGVEV